MNKSAIILLLISLLKGSSFAQKSNVELIVLGTTQDAGSPQIGCKKDCCKDLFINPDKTRKVVSLGIIDHANKKTYLFEATPDITSQLNHLSCKTSFEANTNSDGIFLTHAHIGHYTGLMYLGKEATNAFKVPVYSMPRMKSYLEKNGPWSQLVLNNNIDLKEIHSNEAIKLSEQLTVIPFLVPHRDEFSETVGYKIIGPNKSILFIPDIDKWEKWDRDIIDEIKKVDYAFLDATFYDGEEINNRDISEIPHPFVIESMKLFENLSNNEKSKIHFIHFNHTNPLLNSESAKFKLVKSNGLSIAIFNYSFTI